MKKLLSLLALILALVCALTACGDKDKGDSETPPSDEKQAKYEEAMGLVLDLAIELPVYQRSTLYAYNSKVIKKSSLPTEINPYSSPLDRIWEIELN